MRQYPMQPPSYMSKGSYIFNAKAVGEDRLPYGSPEHKYKAKRQYPEKNLHYMHHDSVMPCTELLRIY